MTTRDLNARLYDLLGMQVTHGYALLRDGSFIETYTHDAQGFPQPLPDIEHDLNAFACWLPRGVEWRIKYASHLDQYVCLLVRGTELFEAFAETEALAAALALEQLLLIAELDAAARR